MATRWQLAGNAVGQKAGNESVLGVMMADIIRLDDGTYRMYYGVAISAPPGSSTSAIKYAESSDAATWVVKGVALQGATTSSDPEAIISGPSIVRLPDGRYRMYYQSAPQQPPGEVPKLHVRSAISGDGRTFTREGVRINIQAYDPYSAFRLAGHGAYFIASDGTVVGVFSGEFASDAPGPSDVKMASSTDGLTFSDFKTLYVKWHDPIVVRTAEGYRMFATYLVEKQGMALSLDGKTWPSQMTDIQLVDQSGRAMTEGTNGVGDLGAVVLPSGAIRLFTNLGNPSTDIVYFDEAR